MANDGSHCLLRGNFMVQHFDCPEYPDGTVTSVLSGEIMSN